MISFKFGRYKFLILTFFLIIFFGAFVYAGVLQLTGWRVNKFTASSDLTGLSTAYGITCKKVVNNSSLDYFVPAGTKFEWDSFAANTPPNVSVVNCDCISFEYSPWSACVNGFQTRYLISSTPTGCIGSPVLSQACNCNLVGCPTGTDCRQGTLYYGSTKCKGGSSSISPTCVANSIPYYACQASGSVSRVWWGVANNLCTTYSGLSYADRWMPSWLYLC